MNKKQEIQKQIDCKKKLLTEKLNQKIKINKIMSGYEEDIFELKHQLKECDELKLEENNIQIMHRRMKCY